MDLQISEISYTLVAPCGVAFFRANCTIHCLFKGLFFSICSNVYAGFDSSVNSWEKSPKYLKTEVLYKVVQQFHEMHFQTDLLRSFLPGFLFIAC